MEYLIYAFYHFWHEYELEPFVSERLHVAKQHITNWTQRGMTLAGASFKAFGNATLALPRVDEVLRNVQERITDDRMTGTEG